MATTWPLTVEFDVPEPRVSKDRMVVSAGGAADPTAWDLSISSGVWCDPITRTLMLAPLCVTSAWRTTATGSYARLTKADYTLTTPGSWKENHRGLAGSVWLESLGVNEVVTTTASYAKNQPMYLNVFVHGIEDLDDTTILECGWGPYGAAGSVALKFRASGAITVYKDNSPVAVYDSQFLVSPGTSGGSKSPSGRGIPILLLPCRRRELLIYLGTNDSAVHAFTDLDPARTDNAITPAGHFWWYVPTGQASVQCAPVRFETSGTAYGPKVNLRYAPEIGRTYSFVPASDAVGIGGVSATLSLVNADTLTAFTPDGVKRAVRIKAVFSDSGTQSLGIYAVDAQFATVTTETADAAVDVTERLLDLSLSLDEEGKTAIRLSTRDIPGMETDGVENVETTGSRPVRVALGSVDIFRGTLGHPRGVPAAGWAYGIADKLEWEGADRSKQFEKYTFAEAWPYDGVNIGDAIVDIAKAAGFSTSALSVTTDTFLLPYTPGMSHGDWQLYPERGDTAALWLDKLHADFAATWIKGWVPSLTGYKYRFHNPVTFTTTPALTLYMSAADAVAAGVTRALAPSRVVRNVTRWTHESEANQIIVVGQDRRTRKIITAQYDDVASQTPETLPADRPDNWHGEIVRYQLIDPDLITTQAAADRAKNILRDRLTAVRNMIEWDSDVLVRDSDDRPLWSGDVVRIYAKGRGSYEDWSIIAIPTMEFLHEDTAGTRVSVRRATYRARRLGDTLPSASTADTTRITADSSERIWR